MRPSTRLLAAFVALSALLLAIAPGPLQSLTGALALPGQARWALLVFSPPVSIALLALIGWRAGALGRYLAALGVLIAVELALKLVFADTASDLGPLHIGSVSLGAYPSGHAARAALICVCACSLVRAKLWRFALLALPFVAALALWLGGTHWLSDVLGGLLLGFGLGVWALEGSARAPAGQDEDQGATPSSPRAQ